VSLVCGIMGLGYQGVPVTQGFLLSKIDRPMGEEFGLAPNSFVATPAGGLFWEVHNG
jgi:hypothetical protein